MRLRLVVKRHDLPDAAIVWPVDDSARVIVSQLLEQVNEIIPLESEGEWGLEDYAVEVRGKEANYECLHFQDVKSILHEDDEVIIRPLLGDDIKQRRASGRYQITSDGIHLFDGAVFGRPRRRAIESRPAVTINPRKRRRVTYTDPAENDLEDEDSDESLLRIEGIPQEIDDRQLVVRAEFDNDDEDESEDDGDFELTDEDMDEDLPVDEDELEGELEALNAESEDDGASDKENIKYGSKMEGVQTGDKLDAKSHNIIQLQEAFPDAPPAICQQIMQNCDMDVGAAYDTLSKGFKPGRSKTAVRSMMLSPRQTTKEPGSSQVQARSVEVAEQETTLVADDQVDKANDEDYEEDDNSDEDEDEDEDGGMAGYYDSHGLPPGSINIGKGLSDIAKSTLAQATNIPLPPSRHSVLRISDSPSSSKSVRFKEDVVLVHDPDAIDLDGDSDDEDDGDFEGVGQSESDSGSSSDSDSSDSGDEEETSTAPAVPTIEDSDDQTPSSGSDDTSSSESESESSSDADSDSDSNSDSDSDSDSEPEVASSKAPVEPKAPTISKPAASSTPKDTGKAVPPGEGRNSTKARNQRRRAGNILQRFKDKGILPAGVTLSEFGKLDIDSNTTPEAAAEALAIARAQIEEEEAIDLRPKTSKGGSKKAAKDAEFEARRQELLASLSAGGVDVGATLTSGKSVAMTPNGTESSCVAKESPPEPASTDKNLTTSASAKKKSKVDMDAGRRLLFGALGLKNPKTKEDEDNIRNKLMKDVKKVKDPEPEMSQTAADDEDMDDWREKITLRAVECCQDGIELSEPPFPFVQRWDPQQQNVYRKGKRGGKGKRNQRNQPEYYEEEQSMTKKQKRNHNSNGSTGYDGYNEYSEEGYNYGETGQYDDVDGQTNDQVMEDSQGGYSEPTDENDLPSLPADTSSLTDIEPKDMKPGMVVAFKQLIMSEATSWQPVISEYRTAVVNIVSDKNEVELTLAIRDREYPERYYNQETGERIYGKFDMPVEDEEEDEDLDDGFRALGFAELMESKLVQAEPENPAVDGLPEAVSDKVTTSTDESTTLAHEQHDAPKEFIETPQVADEDRIFVQVQTEDKSPPRLPSEQLPTIQHSAQMDDEMVDVSITEESRQEICVLMKEAGFRSDIPSSVLKNRPQLPDTPGDNAELKRLAQSMNVSLNGATTPEQSSQLFHVGDEDNSTPTQSNFYPKILVPSSLASQTSDHGQRQPDFPTPGESTLDRFGDSNSFQLSQEAFSLGSVNAETLADEPQLPSIQPNHAGSAPQGPSELSERESSLLDLPSLSEMLSTARSSFAVKQDNPQPSIAPTSTSLGGGDKSYEDAMTKLDAELDARSDPDQNSGDMTPRTRSEDRFISQLLEDVHRQSSEANGTRKAKSPELPSRKLVPNSSPFVVPSGSQQVDLTLSSDAEVGANPENNDDDGDEYDPNMPRGPGWVRKQKSRRRTGGSTANSQASGSQSRTRSQRRRATIGV